MKRFQINSCITFQIVILFLFGCSNNAEISDNSKKSNSSNIVNSANKDFTNKPVNLNNQKDKANYDKQIEELNRNRELWKSQKFSNYNYTMQQFSEGIGNDWKLDFKVRDDKPIQFENLTYPEFHKYEKSDTILDLFDFVESSLGESWKVNVKYNVKFGYPEEIATLGSGNSWNNKKIEKFEIVN